jgi:O-antigen ligase
VLLICLVGVFEATNPGKPLIPGWIVFKNTGASLLSYRAGSVFYDYELLCEFCALNALLVLFLFIRAKSLLLRLAYGGLLLLVAFMMFTTVTRGGLISLGVGILYLSWMVRRRLTMVGTTIVAGAVTAGLIGMNWFVTTYTPSGNMFGRLFGTTIVNSMPESRAAVWPAAWERIFEHPFIGHGPLYTIITSGARIYYWPHSIYLYVANNVGFIGLSVFLWLLWTLFRISRPRTDDLQHPDLTQGYMLIARAQMVVFLVDQIKIEYLRNDIYMFQIWLVFALMVAAHRLQGPDAAHASPAVAHRHASSGKQPPSRSVTP